MLTKRKIIIAIPVVALTLVIFAATGGIMYLHTDEASIRIQKLINQRIPGHISWKSLQFSLLSGQFQLNDFRLDGPNGDRIVSTQTFEVHLAWTSLLRKEIRILHLSLDQPEARIIIDADGKLNLLEAFPASAQPPSETKPSSEPPFNLVVNKMVVSDGTFQFQSKPRDIDIQVSQSAIQASGDLHQRHGQIQITLGPSQIRHQTTTLPIHGLNLKGQLIDGNLKPLKLSIETAVAKATASGIISDLFLNPTGDLNLIVETRLSQADQLFQLPQHLSGTAFCQLMAKGSLTAPELKFILDTDQLAIANHPVKALHLETLFSRRKLHIPNFFIQGLGSQVQASGHVDLTQVLSPQFRPTGPMATLMDKMMTDLTIDADIHLAEIRNLLAKAPSISGNLKTRIAIQGSPNDPDLTCQLDLTQGQIADKSLDRVTLNLTGKDRLVRISELMVQAFSGTLALEGQIDLRTAFAEGVLSKNRNLDEIQYAFTGVGQNLDIASLAANASTTGKIQTRFTLDGSGTTPDRLTAAMEMHLRLEDLSLDANANPITVNMDVATNANQGKIVISRLHTQTSGIEMTAKGLYELATKQFQADANLQASRPETVFTALGLDAALAKGQVRAHVSGHPEKPQLNLIGEVDDVRYKGISLGNIQLKTDLSESGLLQIANLQLDNQGSTIQAKGSVKLFKTAFSPDPEFPMDLTVSVNNFELADFVRNHPTTGTATGKAVITGDMNQILADVKLSAKGIGVSTFRLGDIQLDAKMDHGKVRIPRFRIVNGKSTLDVSGEARLLAETGLIPESDPSFDLNIGSKGIYLEDFLDGYFGKILLSAHARGTKTNPTASVDVSSTGIKIPGQSFNRVTLKGKLQENRFNINHLMVALTPDQTVQGAGWIGLDQTFAVEFHGKDIALTSLDSVRKVGVAEGNINLAFSGKGQFNDPEISGKIVLDQLFVHKKPMENIQMDMTLQNHILEIDGKSNFAMKGRYHVQTGDFSTAISFDTTQLQPYFQLLGREDLSGQITGQILAKGNRHHLQDTTASCQIDEMNLSLNGTPLAKTSQLRASLENRQFVISDSQIQLLDKGFLNVSGTGNFQGTMNLVLEGQIPVAAARMLAQDFDGLEGLITINAVATGNTQSPNVTGQIHLAKVGIRVPTLNQQLHDVSGSIHVSPDAIELKDIAGYLDTGQFSIRGNITLNQFRPLKAQLTANAYQLPIHVPGTLSMTLDTDLKMTGTPDASTLTGNIVLVDGMYYQDVDLSLIRIPEKKRKVKARPKPIDAPFLKNMTLNIAITRKNPFRVDNNLAQLNISPDLSVQGTLNQPVLTGRAKVDSGIVTYQKKDFKVTKGVVDFINPYKIEPSLDVESQVNVRQWLITLKVTGTPDQLDFKLTSDPPEEHADILSLLLFNKTSRELAGGGGPSQSTEQLLAELIASTMGDDIKKATGLDILKVETNEGQSESSDRVKVTMGKNLTRRMAVKYSVETNNGEVVQKTITEYKFLENFLLTGFQNSRGVYGGSFQFRIKFR